MMDKKKLPFIQLGAAILFVSIAASYQGVKTYNARAATIDMCARIHVGDTSDDVLALAKREKANAVWERYGDDGDRIYRRALWHDSPFLQNFCMVLFKDDVVRKKWLD